MFRILELLTTVHQFDAVLSILSNKVICPPFWYKLRFQANPQWRDVHTKFHLDSSDTLFQSFGQTVTNPFGVLCMRIVQKNASKGGEFKFLTRTVLNGDATGVL